MLVLVVLVLVLIFIAMVLMSRKSCGRFGELCPVSAGDLVISNKLVIASVGEGKDRFHRPIIPRTEREHCS